MGEARVLGRTTSVISAGLMALAVGVAPAGAAGFIPPRVAVPGQEADAPLVTGAADGTYALTWAVESEVRGVVRQPGQPFAARTLGAEASEVRQDGNAAGDVAATWLTVDAEDEGSVVAVARAGAGGFGDADRLSTDLTGTSVVAADVAVDAAGTTYVVTTGTVGPGQDPADPSDDAVAVRVSAAPRGGAFTRLGGDVSPAGAEADPSEVAIAVAASGAAAVGYVLVNSDADGETTRTRVQLAQRAPGASFTRASTLADDNPTTSGPAPETGFHGLQVALAVAGSPIAAFLDDDEGLQVVDAGAPARPLAPAVDSFSLTVGADDTAGLAYATGGQVLLARRAPGGAFAAGQPVGPGEAPAAAVQPDGTIAVAFTQGVDATKTVQAARQSPGGLPVAQQIAGPDEAIDNPAIAADGRGGLLVAFRGADPVGGALGVTVVPFDAVAPGAESPSVTSATLVGAPATFRLTPTDDWGVPADGVRWNPGDGSPELTGTEVTHRYGQAREQPYGVRATVTDAAGNRSAVGPFDVQVSAPAPREEPQPATPPDSSSPPAAPPASPAPPAAAESTLTPNAAILGDTTAPVVGPVRLTRRSFAVASRATAQVARAARAAQARGTSVRFSLSEPATTRLLVQLETPGARRGACVRRTPSTQRRTCVFHKTVGRFVRRLGAGRAVIAFSGRVDDRALRRGRYRLVVFAVDSSGNRSASRTAHFTVR